MDSICDKVPPPEQLPDDDGEVVRAKVIDSWFETKRGVVALVRLLSGTLAEGDRISIVEPASCERPAEGGAGGGHRVVKDNVSVQESESQFDDTFCFLMCQTKLNAALQTKPIQLGW